MSGAATPRLLAVFPSFEEIGGVQASGAAAWRGIAAASDGDNPTFDPVLLTYGSSPIVTDLRRRNARTRAGAAAQALGLAGRFDLALFWHLSLLKLRPFLLRAPRRTALFLHGIEVWRPLDRVQKGLVSALDLVLCNSFHTWQRFVEANPWASALRHEVVSLGLGTPHSGPVPKPENPSSAVMIGRLEAREGYKGHREVITAWPEVLVRLPGARLRIVGDGSARHVLEEIARAAGVADSVEFLGEASEEAKDAALARASALLLPSRAEGFGLVYLEAMRLGRPCLVSDSDAGREVVAPPETGLAVDPASPEAVADAAARLLARGPEWEAWSSAALARYRANYTEKGFQRRLLAVLGQSGVDSV